MLKKKKPLPKPKPKTKGKKKMAWTEEKKEEQKPQHGQKQEQQQSGSAGQKPVEQSKQAQQKDREQSSPVAAVALGQKVVKGQIQPPEQKEPDFEEKKPEELTGPEQEQVFLSGGVLPKEQHDKEQAVQQGKMPEVPGQTNQPKEQRPGQQQ